MYIRVGDYHLITDINHQTTSANTSETNKIPWQEIRVDEEGQGEEIFQLHCSQVIEVHLSSSSMSIFLVYVFHSLASVVQCVRRSM